MIDLILWSPDKATLRDFAVGRGLLSRSGDEYVLREGVDYCWWAGSGRFMIAKGDENTAPTFAPGVVALMRLYFPDDRLSGDGEQWNRSKVAKHVKSKGTPGKMGAINYYEIDGVRLFRAQDVLTWLAANDLPGHEWMGGNAL